MEIVINRGDELDPDFASISSNAAPSKVAMLATKVQRRIHLGNTSEMTECWHVKQGARGLMKVKPNDYLVPDLEFTEPAV